MGAGNRVKQHSFEGRLVDGPVLSASLLSHCLSVDIIVAIGPLLMDCRNRRGWGCHAFFHAVGDDALKNACTFAP